MKELIDAIWNMPASEFIALLIKVGVILIGFFALWVVFGWWRFRQFKKTAKGQREEFRRRYGL